MCVFPFSKCFLLCLGAAGVLVGHPFDTVKVGKGLTLQYLYVQFLIGAAVIIKQTSVLTIGLFIKMILLIYHRFTILDALLLLLC